jgi:hypothetical protein
MAHVLGETLGKNKMGLKLGPSIGRGMWAGGCSHATTESVQDCNGHVPSNPAVCGGQMVCAIGKWLEASARVIGIRSREYLQA